MESNLYTKKLCMSEFSIRLSTIPQSRFFDIQKNESLVVAFIYIEEGAAILRTDTLTLRLAEGSLLYIPEKTSYTLQWLSTDKIKYYTIFAIATDYNTALLKDKFPIQIISQLSNKNTGNSLERIYTFMSSNERIQKIQAVSLYYSFYAEALQYLRYGETPAYHPALLKAIEILSSRFSENTLLCEIAKECFISETRLYHLFKEQIGCSPITFRNEKRIQKAAELLKTEMSVEEICAQTGFNSVAYFYETFKKLTKLTPNEYRKLIQ